MTELAIDRWRARGLPPRLESRAQHIADEVGWLHPHAANGWLSGSIAEALERPWWKSRDRLAVDLRVIEILTERHAITERRP